ncbi:MAG TPA: hypothetical protein VEH84_01925 [Alphaproteobacteria bacterium]|nr:hypothetical protein [Alphaproteobacteria bacterium]
MNPVLSDSAIVLMLKTREHCYAMADLASALTDSPDAVRLIGSAERLTAVLAQVEPERLARLVAATREHLGRTQHARPRPQVI